MNPAGTESQMTFTVRPCLIATWSGR